MSGWSHLLFACSYLQFLVALSWILKTPYSGLHMSSFLLHSIPLFVDWSIFLDSPFWQMTVKLLFRKQLMGVPGSGNRQKSQRLEPAVTDYVGSRAGIRFFNSRTVPISYTEKEARKGSFHISAEFLQHLGASSVQLTHIYVPLTTTSYTVVRLYRQQVNQFTWVILSVLIT